MSVNKFAAKAKAAAESGILNNLTETTTGGSRLLPEGMALAVFTGYIESGLQPQEFQGQVKDPRREFQLEFHIVGGMGVTKDGIDEAFVPDDTESIAVHTFWTPLQNNSKSRCIKYFNAMNYKGTATSFAELLGTAFMLPVVHKEGKDRTTGKSVIRANIDPAGIIPAVDPMTRKPYAVPELPEDVYRLFLWDAPDEEQWNSILIEGTWDDGKSKNILQEHILSSMDYEGSALQEMLCGAVTKAPQASKTSQAPLDLPDPD